jgi:hypothetical protein
MIDSEQQRVAIMQTVLRVLTVKAGGEIIVTKDDYLELVDETNTHFHMVKTGEEIKLVNTLAVECQLDVEESKMPKIFGPDGNRIQ